jgi:hypothetical protein
MITATPIQLGLDAHEGWLVKAERRLIAVLCRIDPDDDAVCLAAGFDTPFDNNILDWPSLDAAMAYIRQTFRR